MRRIITGLLLTMSSIVHAIPFESCPSTAFLVQNARAKTFSVNLSTGEYGLAQDDMDTTGKVNAIGFNPNDNYLYGWSYKHGRAARMGADFKVEPLEITQLTGANYYIGDVSHLTNEYYVYRRGGGHGLYAISLDPAADGYMDMRKIIDGGTLNLKIFDFAFHPEDGLAYSVNKNGSLYQINASDGTSALLGGTGVTGTFGAVYFDASGMLYISRNKDGHIFKIDINSGNYTAQLFSTGPSSSVNDGARCALAAITNETNTDIDFGDAPASYGTLMKDNGARHALPTIEGAQPSSGSLHLGLNVDGESDATPFPMSDDLIDENNDDDGVQFATGLISDSKAVLLIRATGTAYVNAWIDFQQDGVFNTDDAVITDKLVGAGTNVIFIDVPADATIGDTWARFRLSSVTQVEPTGGVADGEVEDYQVSIAAAGSAVTYYPSSSSWTTLAFEDNWPIEGDYDMNDLVVYMRTATYRTDGLISLVNISGEIAAVGAAYHNGFAVRLPGVKRSQIDESGIKFTINDRQVTTYSPLEAGSNEAIFIVMHNVWDYVSAGEDCIFYRTEVGCGSEIQARFELNIPLLEPTDVNLSGAFDPFMFATPGAWHGAHYPEAPGRRYEIHLKNQRPTERFDLSLRNVAQGVDITDPAIGQYYQTLNGLPWALEIGTRWQYPREYQDLLDAYPTFEKFSNSNGEQAASWFKPEAANPDVLFTD